MSRSPVVRSSGCETAAYGDGEGGFRQAHLSACSARLGHHVELSSIAASKNTSLAGGGAWHRRGACVPPQSALSRLPEDYFYNSFIAEVNRQARAEGFARRFQPILSRRSTRGRMGGIYEPDPESGHRRFEKILLT